MKTISNRNLNMWEESLREYSGLVFTICYTMTGDYFEAEDLAQETFLSAYRNLHRFQGENMKAWLTKIASNKCRDYLKSAARKSLPSSDESFIALADPEPLPEDVILQKDVNAKLYRLCGKLKEPYQTVALEHFVRGRDPAQIALDQGKNVKTIQTQIYRARSMLNHLWKEEFR
ncbi:MAG: sigma-70 family RNA polymerase sigma factor [Clostridiales bacterium]|nr:sigma-70 family RNA polymerase sigma factor [Clostridiales bacterium]